jgi:hypothetical protein
MEEDAFLASLGVHAQHAEEVEKDVIDQVGLHFERTYSTQSLATASHRHGQQNFKHSQSHMLRQQILTVSRVFV